MSKRITSFFKKADVTASGLPVPSSPVEKSVNKEVEEALKDSATPSRKRKRGTYGEYSPQTRGKIARYAIENGNSKTARHFSNILHRTINESTVRSIKASFEKRKCLEQSYTGSDLQMLSQSPRGRPLKIGKYDERVKDYINKLRIAGGVVNSRIVTSAAKGFILAEDKTLLQQFGGHISLDKSWATSFMKHMGLAKRKGTKGVKHLPKDFDTIKDEFLRRIHDNVKQYNIPDELIINWDQTGSNYVPVSSWTMEKKGSKQVQISQLDDKRQMTVLLACTKSGALLPPQLLYQGKTDACHASYKFPDEWDVWHTESHWSNGESMERFVKTIIIPYVEKIREDLDLPLRQRALCIFDIFKAHQGEELRNLLKSQNIQMVYVPASCTDRLQPLDLSVNSIFKGQMKQCFEDFYANEITSQLKSDPSREIESVDLRLSVVKPLHAKWLDKCLHTMNSDVDMIKRGWIQSGISNS